METPSSARPLTRSQTSKLANTGDGFLASRPRDRRTDRLALLDITNESPIAGIANDVSGTPASKTKSVARLRPGDTPCSGEMLLRGQVKSLLQRVEEESEIPKVERVSLLLPQIVIGTGRNLISPASLLAPTPANTPVIVTDPVVPQNFGSIVELGVSCLGSICEENEADMVDLIPVLAKGSSLSSENSFSRALSFDFDSPEKSEVVDPAYSSDLSSQEITDEENKNVEEEEDDDSGWSVNVNVSSPAAVAADAEKTDSVTDEYDDFNYMNMSYEDDYEEEAIDDELCDELCVGLNKILVVDDDGDSWKFPKYEGKHTRFEYDSDGELVEEVVMKAAVRSSPNVLRLNGIPAPQGKHLRFHGEEEDDDLDQYEF